MSEGTRTVLVLNGPNLSRLGSREPDVYGSASYAELEQCCARAAEQLGLRADVRQSDDEAVLIGWLHEAADSGSAVVINPAAFTHYSYALRDAVAIVRETGVPVVEVHLSNPAAREEFRHVSVIAGAATGSITGFGLDSYRLALQAVAAHA
jgi:3-dehydroquinate dehydratase-2